MGRVTGIVKFYNTKKGYGFCRRNGGSDVFLHSKELNKAGIGDVKTGDPLDFIIEESPRGCRALDIKRIKGPAIAAA